MMGDGSGVPPPKMIARGRSGSWMVTCPRREGGGWPAVVISRKVSSPGWATTSSYSFALGVDGALLKSTPPQMRKRWRAAS